MPQLGLQDKKMFGALLTIVIVILCVLFQQLTTTKGIAPLPAFWGLLAVAHGMFFYLWVGCSDYLDHTRRVTKENRFFILILLLPFIIPYFIYGFGVGDWQPLNALKIVAYVLAPTLFLLKNSDNQQNLRWQDGVAILLLWFPVEWGLIQDVWSWPNGMGRNVYTVPMAISVTVVLMAGFRRLDQVGFKFRWDRQDFRPILVNLISFLVIAIPIGIFTHFIHWTGNPVDPLKLISTLLVTFFLVAIPEEVLFRGVIQNILQKSMNKKSVAMVIASVLFGLTHWNNTPEPDWRYIGLATIAGMFYGRTFNAARTLMPAATVHALVDTIWISFFR